MSTKNEMVCNGLIRISELRDIYGIFSFLHFCRCLTIVSGPVRLVCNKIPRAVMEKLYGITLPAPKEGELEGRPPTPAGMILDVLY